MLGHRYFALSHVGAPWASLVRQLLVRHSMPLQQNSRHPRWSLDPDSSLLLGGNTSTRISSTTLELPQHSRRLLRSLLLGGNTITRVSSTTLEVPYHNKTLGNTKTIFSQTSLLGFVLD
jgi:hypothetical protein